jgi:hypothetical protein
LDAVPAAGSAPTYQPDDGFGMLSFGVMLVAAAVGWALIVPSSDVRWAQGWVLLTGLGCLLIGVLRRSQFRRHGSQWPLLPQGVAEPREPFSFISGDKTKDVIGASNPSREPWIVFCLACAFAGLGVALVRLEASRPDLRGGMLAFPAVFLLVSLPFFVVAVARWRWMSRYRRLVGHLPW